MISYILFIVFAGLMVLIAFGFIVGGLLKKNRKIWIGGLVGLVIFVLFSAFSAYLYVKESVNYLRSNEFQAETRKKAEGIGRTLGSTISGTAQGLGETLDDEAITTLAKKGSKIVGNGVKAIATGLDESVGKTTVFTDETVSKSGIKVGRAEEKSNSQNYSFSLFLDFESDFDGKLKLTAYDSEGLKQDNTVINIQENAGTGKVYNFQFENFSPGISGYCILTKE